MFKTVDTQRRSDLDVLFYTIWMLNALPLEELAQRGNPVLLNACIESFLLHARKLINFLEGTIDKKGNKDDLTCSRFTNASGKQISKTPVYLPQKLKEKLNKHLGHLTIFGAQEKLDWDCESIRKSINYSLAEFVRLLSSDYFPTIEGIQKADFEKVIAPKNN